ncbi:metal cation transporter, ZIP family [Dictyocaulus viviparus]|uniref:Metal cation transporter, ZIP family n=1 Tax=Dictyocaulus viviparus TaxID=29172 RepID=A0A0D8XKI4_DICVI|nr:metal cation transporter, ZIP family [Dictyocaulus viviparus]
MSKSLIWVDTLYSLNDKSTALKATNDARNSLRALLLLTLFGLTFGSTMSATVLRGEWARSDLSSFIACFGGGVFLSTCLLDLLPDAIELYEKADFNITFPVAEAAVVVVLTMKERGAFISGRTRVNDEEDMLQTQASSSTVVEEKKNSVLGAMLLVLALSLHALFEGLSLAVISDASKLLEVFVALALHKSIIGFSFGVRLVQSGFSTPWIALSSFSFSIQILIGGLGGMEIMTILSGGDRKAAALVSSILQGIACGTFLYITTFEVIPHEFDKDTNRLFKLSCLFAGVAVIVFLLYFLPGTD